MAKHWVKCLYCGEDFDANAEEYTQVSARRYAHKKCADEHTNNLTKEEKDKLELEEYIKNLFHTDVIAPRIKQQINSYRQQYNYTYSGIRKTLMYFFEIKGNSTEKANGGIGIVPWCYEDASKYWYGIWQAQQANQTKIIEAAIPTEVVHIVSPKREPMRQFRKLFTFLDKEREE